MPADKELLYRNLRRLAKLPFRASPWKFDEYYLGFCESELDKLLSFMLKYYDKDFAHEIHGLLLKNYQEYMDVWLLRLHETQFMNYMLARVQNLYKKAENSKYIAHARASLTDAKLAAIEKRLTAIEQELSKKNC